MCLYLSFDVTSNRRLRYLSVLASCSPNGRMYYRLFVKIQAKQQQKVAYDWDFISTGRNLEAHCSFYLVARFYSQCQSAHGYPLM